MKIERALMSEQMKRYLYLLHEQHTANWLGEGDRWDEHMDEMDALWRGFTDAEQDEVERQFQLLKSTWNAPVTVAKEENWIDADPRIGPPKIQKNP